MLLRMGKRRTSWESDDAHEIADTEFRNRDNSYQLTPSVYKLDAPSVDEGSALVLRAAAEHAANAGLYPPGPGVHLDVEPAYNGPLRAAPDSKWFCLIRETHRTLLFQHAAQLLGWVGALVASGRLPRHTLSKAEVRAYVAHRLGCGDEEWTAFVAAAPKGPKWDMRPKSA